MLLNRAEIFIKKQAHKEMKGSKVKWASLIVVSFITHFFPPPNWTIIMAGKNFLTEIAASEDIFIL